eukprot:CAMPEP_0170211944 /NCGR_PEP_ID=MMETSP0116_2-20130129/5590_1 /TAXON_ID=400756 /ORGANISM="Durinskia baltica, Strain CSIRO CS-38" /LENGTH=583 /DNA_ID=CAMNT_0010462483 /DNA_START=153 /DNA_END=1900 /DNA_ORIENTATION=-
MTGINRKAQPKLDFEDAAILRGSSVDKVLRRFAHVLGKQECTAEYYELSERVDHIDAFISHNWSTPKNLKFLTLALHFNLLPAIVVSTGVAARLYSSAWRPLGASAQYDEAVDEFGMLKANAGVWCQVVGFSTFAFMLIFWPEVARLVNLGTARVFLDKTCVHQTDMELKRKGIANLAAFLSHSWSMVVLYSDVYLTKLWTVYEIATFMLIFPRGRLHVRPVFLPKLVLSCMCLLVMLRATEQIVMGDNNGKDILQGILKETWAIGPDQAYLVLRLGVSVPITIAVSSACAWWAKQRSLIRNMLQEFEIENATCQSEEDRRLVERNIAIFAAKYELVELEDLSQEKALQKFNDFVHDKVHQVIERSLGNAGIPYRYALAMFIIFHFYNLDVLASKINCGAGAFELIISAVTHVTIYACVGPLGVALCAMIPKLFVGYRWPRTVSVAVSTPLLLVIQGLALILMRRCSMLEQDPSRNHIDHGVIHVLVCLAIMFFAYWIYRRPAKYIQPHRHLRASVSSGSGHDGEEADDNGEVRGHRLRTLTSLHSSSDRSLAVGGACNGHDASEDDDSSDTSSADSDDGSSE